MEQPVCYDLYCGLGGWAEAFLAELYTVIGFDIERHDYGTGAYPGRLVLQDVVTIHGAQLSNAAVIVFMAPRLKGRTGAGSRKPEKCRRIGEWKRA